ncbi:retron St85 family RNA-directed DNA polymerase [Clostridium sp. SHJSY1]|uniref:retron St85 family RNA-directed DNA polymerase n=1 Tax=Clostridium sp. SHJSY1 TaxID=2942483 RepID=UPI0028758EA4|nr:retron St85 family RNA-directed DNA polymerase [Clostridium sp. SHJSY1]MDS0527612.1 retron St85 family RNA-directed DNA polymerase [Clostridium sp. SHJSY1]
MILELMSKDLNLDEEFILKISEKNTAYKKYRIPKKKGGYRTIYHPSKELKLLQYWLVKRIFSKFPISKCSTAYSKGNSIKKNALIHKNSNYMLHLDITNFFESISHYHLDRILRKIDKIDSTDMDLIKRIVFYKGEYLVIGSVASPIISNCIMYDIDEEIINKCIRGRNLIYTRYADDIIISSKEYIGENIIKDIKAILDENKFVLNEQKTYFMNKKSKRAVTGIVIDNNNNSLSIGSKKYREVKRVIYSFLVKNQGNRDNILGSLAFIKDIDIKKYNNLKEIYSKYDKNNTLF